MNKELAYCGLDCTECPAYIAKRTQDDELRRRTSLEWGSDDFAVNAEDINCDGCKATDGERWRWCSQCEVRACAVSRNVATCASCSDYGCDKLTDFLQMAGEEPQKRLEQLREMWLKQ